MGSQRKIDPFRHLAMPFTLERRDLFLEISPALAFTHCCIHRRTEQQLTQDGSVSIECPWLKVCANRHPLYGVTHSIEGIHYEKHYPRLSSCGTPLRLQG